MKVLVFDDNLMWAPRLRQTLAGLGHEPIMLSWVPEALPEAQVAIVNLSSSRLEVESLIRTLKAQGRYVIGHAGHKEVELREMGRVAGCDQILSNSQTTFSLEKALDLVVLPDSDSPD
ncbi:MAG: hypothetical protein K1X67_06975 [Fimbriimonadaceae bacterium]|nr:hypothetical protein [Fimbriimonadaceae bacterium]